MKANMSISAVTKNGVGVAIEFRPQ